MQTGFDFPTPFTEKYKPQAICNFLGIEKPRKLAAALVQKPFSSAWMFIGASGMGKTTLALAIANEMPAELHHIPARACDLETIRKTFDACQYAPRLIHDWTLPCKMHLVLIDEAHTMTQAAQDAMLSYLDATAMPAQTIVIGTCNSLDNFEKPFLSRFRQVPFSSYGMNEEISELLSRIWDAETNGAPKPNFQRIAKDSTNNVRDALMNLEIEVMSL